MPGNLDSRRARIKDALRRRRIEVVLPRRNDTTALHQARFHRFNLPRDVESTRGDAGPDMFFIDVSRVMNRAQFRFGRGGWHPYVAALEELLDGSSRPHDDSVLASFYAHFQPATVHDVLLGDDVPRRVIAEWPVVDSLLDVWSVRESLIQRVTSQLAQTPTPRPSQYRGPQSLAHVGHQLDHLHQIHVSVRDTGYRPSDFARGVPTGYFLVEGDDYRFVLGHGNHQLAVLTVLGIPHVPVKLRYQHPPVITRRDLRRWTTDGGGLFSMAEAVALFDSYFTDVGLKLQGQGFNQ